jgi:hypothetical protein
MSFERIFWKHSITQVSKNSHEYLLLFFLHNMIILCTKIYMFTTHIKYIFDYCELYFVKMSD